MEIDSLAGGTGCQRTIKSHGYVVTMDIGMAVLLWMNRVWVQALFTESIRADYQLKDTLCTANMYVNFGTRDLHCELYA